MLKSVITVLLSSIIGGQLLTAFGIDARSMFIAMMVGAIIGGIGKFAFDVARGNSKHSSRRVFLEIIGVTMMVAGCGSFVMSVLMAYFRVNQRIADGQFTEDIIYQGVIAFGCAVVAGGRLGLEWIWSVLKSVIEKAFGVKK